MNTIPLLQLLTTLAQTSAEDSATVRDFSQQDPHGFIMAMLGMGIVFTILILLYLVFSNTPKLFVPANRQRIKDLFKKKVPDETAVGEADVAPAAEIDLTGEVNAAISAAIHLYRSELHDFEESVLTMKKVSRTYSPWSSKIYGLRNLNQA